jgi:hypothetical protein
MYFAWIGRTFRFVFRLFRESVPRGRSIVSGEFSHHKILTSLESVHRVRIILGNGCFDIFLPIDRQTF